MAEMTEKLSFLTRDGARTMAQAALRFVLDDPTVSSVVVGAKTPAQVAENLAAVHVPPIDTTERERIAGAF